MYNIDKLFQKISNSKFRSSFKLKDKDFKYIENKGLKVIEKHTRDFVRTRLAPKDIPNDGKQTPMHGHPVFIAQHATATCCRGCLYKWHHIAQNKELTKDEQDYIVKIIMTWIKKEIQNNLHK